MRLACGFSMGLPPPHCSVQPARAAGASGAGSAIGCGEEFTSCLGYEEVFRCYIDGACSGPHDAPAAGGSAARGSRAWSRGSAAFSNSYSMYIFKYLIPV